MPFFYPERAEAVECARQQPKTLPLVWEFWLVTPLGLTCAAARCYQIVEVFVGLRSLEPSAYLNVEWSSFIPRI